MPKFTEFTKWHHVDEKYDTSWGFDKKDAGCYMYGLFRNGDKFKDWYRNERTLSRKSFRDCEAPRRDAHDEDRPTDVADGRGQ